MAQWQVWTWKVENGTVVWFWKDATIEDVIEWVRRDLKVRLIGGEE